VQPVSSFHAENPGHRTGQATPLLISPLEERGEKKALIYFGYQVPQADAFQARSNQMLFQPYCSR
jgi:hypothetical protein